jgi:chorismate synthase
LPIVVAGAVAKQLLKEKNIQILAKITSMGDAEQAQKEGDTVGGVVECRIMGAPAGLGEPMFGKFSAELAHAIFSLPAVKGFEIGDGFALAQMKGSEANDSFINKEGRITTSTNHSGGIQGGITNGNDIVFRVAFKPIPSLMKPQQTVNRAGETCEIAIEGRHDVCALPRAIVLVEAMAAMVTVDMMLMQRIF